MDVTNLRCAAELLSSFSGFNAYEFGSLSVVGHFFHAGEKYGEARFSDVEQKDRWDFSNLFFGRSWDFLPTLDNPDFSLSAPFTGLFSLTDAEHAFIEKVEKAVNRGAGEDPVNDEWPSVLAFSRLGRNDVIVEILHKDTSKRIGHISYDPQAQAYTFKAACQIQRMR
jgi:hypothetical protein